MGLGGFVGIACAVVDFVSVLWYGDFLKGGFVG